MDLLANMVSSAWSFQGPRPSFEELEWGVGRTFWPLCLAWMSLWGTLLNMGEGARAKSSIYRLHFWHGIVGPVIAVLHVLGKGSFHLTMACTLAYFFVDVLNMIANDVFLGTKGYQKPSNRLIEYIHHAIVVFSGMGCLYLRESACRVEELGPGLAWEAGPRSFNPFVPLIVNEASTPLLILYREHRTNSIIGPAFAVVFFLIRIVLNSVYFAPLLFNGCNREVIWWPQAFPFFAIQWVFFYQIIAAVLGLGKKGKGAKSEAADRAPKKIN
uniref:TLC domain-containing protein n=1 Tax=Pinguiococcus pyrenoidosus TaxID=172671 RepID=A0A7R9UGG0_9STRA|mmetsp:Transcript_7405/g.28078  ORF Transcript_7405/g.28078 Transcript_7405/m.28078 type:complete len:271 (+) Transcript_7405:88-900(+)